jgi:hypothetical protein
VRYDSTGRLIRRVYPSKTVAGQLDENDYNSYTYDANSNIHIERKRSGATITHTYDNNNLLILKDLSNNTHSGDVYYKYDLRGLTLYSRFGGDTGQGVTNTFNGFGNLSSTSINMGDNTRTLSYQGNNNRSGSYIPNGLNQYTHIAGQPLSYDANGNLTNDGSTIYTYDMENRLVSTSGSAASVFKYDPLGRLHEVTVASNTTRFLYDVMH